MASAGRSDAGQVAGETVYRAFPGGRCSSFGALLGALCCLCGGALSCRGGALSCRGGALSCRAGALSCRGGAGGALSCLGAEPCEPCEGEGGADVLDLSFGSYIGLFPVLPWS